MHRKAKPFLHSFLLFFFPLGAKKRKAVTQIWKSIFKTCNTIVKTGLIYALQTLIQFWKSIWTSSYNSTYKENISGKVLLNLAEKSKRCGKTIGTKFPLVLPSNSVKFLESSILSNLELGFCKTKFGTLEHLSILKTDWDWYLFDAALPVCK